MKISNRVSKFRSLIVATIAVLTLHVTAKAADGMEARRKAQNAECLAQINVASRPKFAAVVADMEKNGYKPLIDIGVWRSQAEQLEKFRRGVSKVRWSFHNASTPNGKPDSLAADIVDQRWGWTGYAPRGYWLRLANAGRSHGLYSGANFGLSTRDKANLKAALVARNFNYSGRLGWDLAHLEVSGLTLAQAKAGRRP